MKQNHNFSINKLQLYLLIGFFSIFFLFLRFHQLPERMIFGSDQGRDFLIVWNMLVNKRFTLIGPPSEFTVHGRQFFFGPASYYVIIPALFLGKWNPLAVSYYVIMINYFVISLVTFLLQKYLRNKQIIFIFIILFTFSPALITYTQSYWNPYLMLPIATLILPFLYRKRNEKEFFPYAILGFLYGLGMEFHFSFLLAIVVSFAILLYKKTIAKLQTIAIILGIIIGFLPLIIYDLLHNFYNLQSLFLILEKSDNLHSRFILQPFYFISLIPFFLLFIANIFVKLSQQYPKISRLILFLYILWSLVSFFTVKISPFNYLKIRHVADAIVADHPVAYNIVDKYSLDNRGYAIRYLLTVNGAAPKDVTEYTMANTLYVYTDKPLVTLLNKPVWEIETFLPFETTYGEQLDENTFLYKLQK